MVRFVLNEFETFKWSTFGELKMNSCLTLETTITITLKSQIACSHTEKSTCRQCVCVEHHFNLKATSVATNNIAKAVSIQFENMLSWCWETNYLNYLWWANESENQQTKHTHHVLHARLSPTWTRERPTKNKNKMQIHWDRDRMRKRKAATVCFWF